MLSQRLGLLSDELINADNQGTKNKLLNDYESALRKFSDNHTSLYELNQLDVTSDSIKSLYAGEAGVDKRSRRFIALAKDILEALFIFRPIVKTSALRQKQLEKSNNELMEFSFRISHDLRAPIASSRGMLEIAQDAIEDDDKEVAKDVTGRIEVLLKRLETLIEDIISVTRNSITETEPEKVNLRAIITNTMEELSAMPGYEKCQFDVDIDDKTEIVTNKLFLKQIVQNLLSNAIKYSNIESDLDASRISISGKRVGKLYELCIEDNGIGIPESSRNKIFNMFMRFHPGVSNGSGLGLYLSQQNAIALGGNLRYEPREQGSRFTLKFQPQKA